MPSCQSHPIIHLIILSLWIGGSGMAVAEKISLPAEMKPTPSWDARAVYGPCVFKECGVGGPFPTLERGCAFLQRVTVSAPPDELVCPYHPDAIKSTDNRSNEAVVFFVTLPTRTVHLLAIRNRKEWHLMGELGIVHHPGAMGISGNMDVKTIEWVPLVPGEPAELRLEYRIDYQDIDLGVNRVTTESVVTTWICGLRQERPYCLPRIPKKWLKKRTLLEELTPEEIVDLPPSSDPGDKLYDHQYELKLQFAPTTGEVTITKVRGSLPHGLAPVLGTHRIVE